MLNILATNEEMSAEEEHILKSIYVLSRAWSAIDYPYPDAIEAASSLKEVFPFLNYEGNVYRGIGIEDEDIPNLFENKYFRTRDTRDVTAKQSWSADVNIALSYAAGYVSVVLKKHSSNFDVVAYISTENRDRLNDYYDKAMAKYDIQNYRKTPVYKHKSRDLQEVMIKTPKSEKYNLCQDVIYVGMDVRHYIERDEAGYKDIILSAMDEETKNYIVNKEYDWRFMIWFECNDKGSLKFSGFQQ